MRGIILLLVLSTMASAQSNFKTVQFGGSSPSINQPLPVKKVPGLLKSRANSEDPIDYKSLQFVPGTGNTQLGSVDFTDLNGHSFWAQSSSKLSFNQRAANSSVYAFLNQFKVQLKISDVTKEFAYVSKEVDDLGMQHIKVIQSYKGIPIYGGELIVHGKNDEMNHVNGIVFPSPLKLDLNASLSPEQARDIIIKDLQTQNKYVEVISASFLKLIHRDRVTSEMNIYYDDQDVAHLAYVVSIIANGLDIWIYKIDAHSGEILKKYNNTCSFLPEHESHSFIEPNKPESKTNTYVKATNFDFGNTTSNTVDLFGKTITLNTYQDGSTFYLVDASRPMFVSIGNDNEEPTGVIWTFDGKNSSPAFKSFNPALINSPTNNGWISQTATSAHFNAGVAYSYYLNTFGRSSVNGKGGNIISLVNIVEEDGKQMDNAFWDGEAMFYGNGKDAFLPLAKALDVAGHELSHGVIQTTANLDYDTESGALNESFADVFGRLIDRDDWGMGEDVVKKSIFPTGVLRSFIDPHNGGNQLSDPGYQPRIYSERYKGTEDNGGVHINSGIPNWAFYKFTTAINDLNKAEKVYYRTLTKYLTRSSRFIDCRKAVIQSTADLYGANGAEVIAAKAAFDAVGILDGASTTTQQDVQTNPGQDFIVYTDDAQTGLFLADATGKIVANPFSTVPPLSRPSVTDDGTSIVFIGKDKKIHYIIIDWSLGKVTDAGILQSEPIWRNVVISRQGNLLAAVKDAQENMIDVFDFDAQEWKFFTLYNPTFSNGIKTGAVNYSDAMEFDYSGTTLIYDANNTISNSAGADVEYWDISFLRVYNKSTRTFGDGKISKLFGQLPEKTSVGNPTFSKNSPFIIAFDMLIEKTGGTTYLCLGGNTETGKIDTIFVNGQLSWPNYSKTDDKVIFNAQTTSGSKVIGQVNVDNSKINAIGSASALINSAKLGVWFANGERAISTATNNEALTRYALRLLPNPVTNNNLALQWNQPVTRSESIFSIYDITGKLQWNLSAKYSSGLQLVSIPVNRLAAGMYVFNAAIDGKSGSIKFVKE